MNNSYVRKQLLVAFLCIICSGLVAYNGDAATSNKGDTTLNVITSDIDMSSNEGITTLYLRLKKAADKVCGSKKSYGTGATIESRENNKSYEGCIANALNNAVQSINNDKLTALHKI